MRQIITIKRNCQKILFEFSKMIPTRLYFFTDLRYDQINMEENTTLINPIEFQTAEMLMLKTIKTLVKY